MRPAFKEELRPAQGERVRVCKAPQTGAGARWWGGLEQKFIFPRFWRWKSDPGVGRAASPSAVSSRCVHTCVSVSISSSKDSSHSGLGPTLVTTFYPFQDSVSRYSYILRHRQ